MRRFLIDDKRQSGDTIVEVLVALAIIGMVLAAAYTTANRSIQITRQSQERTEAVKVAENQLEVIKSIAGSVEPMDGSEEIWDGEVFCIKQSDSAYVPYDDTGAELPDLWDAELTMEEPPDNGFYPQDCVFSTLYHVYVGYDDDDERSRFLVNVRWERIGGGGMIDEVQYIYGIAGVAP